MTWRKPVWVFLLSWLIFDTVSQSDFEKGRQEDGILELLFKNVLQVELCLVFGA